MTSRLRPREEQEEVNDERAEVLTHPQPPQATATGAIVDQRSAKRARQSHPTTTTTTTTTTTIAAAAAAALRRTLDDSEMAALASRQPAPRLIQCAPLFITPAQGKPAVQPPSGAMFGMQLLYFCSLGVFRFFTTANHSGTRISQSYFDDDGHLAVHFSHGHSKASQHYLPSGGICKVVDNSGGDGYYHYNLTLLAYTSHLQIVGAGACREVDVTLKGLHDKYTLATGMHGVLDAVLTAAASYDVSIFPVAPRATDDPSAAIGKLLVSLESNVRAPIVETSVSIEQYGRGGHFYVSSVAPLLGLKVSSPLLFNLGCFLFVNSSSLQNYLDTISAPFQPSASDTSHASVIQPSSQGTEFSAAGRGREGTDTLISLCYGAFSFKHTLDILSFSAKPLMDTELHDVAFDPSNPNVVVPLLKEQRKRVTEKLKSFRFAPFCILFFLRARKSSAANNESQSLSPPYPLLVCPMVYNCTAAVAKGEADNH